MAGRTVKRRAKAAQPALAIADLVSVLVFVAIGRSVHDHGVHASGLVSTAWPFVVGLVTGWIALTGRRRSGATLRGGAVVWLCTVVVGMLLRVIAGQGTTLAFILVAFAFLGLFMFGWRILFKRVRRRW